MQDARRRTRRDFAALHYLMIPVGFAGVPVAMYEAEQGYVLLGAIVGAVGVFAGSLALARLRGAKRWPFSRRP